MKKLWHAVEKLLGVYRWHPKIALRYLPAVETIRRKNGDRQGLHVLEVGSGGLGIVPYLKRTVVGLDVSFDPPYHPLLIPIKGDTTHIPFSDNSFDIVVSMDMLEHLPMKRRAQAIHEMVRVTKKLLCLGVPSGEQAAAQDARLRVEYRKQKGREFPFLSEQVSYGLPHADWIADTIKQAALATNKRFNEQTTGNINLSVRNFLMRGWLSDTILVNIFFRKILLLGLPILKRLNQEPTYRKLFFVEFS